MKIIKPITIDYGDITSNNLSESAAEYSSSYSGGSGVYDVDDEVKVTGTAGGAATATYHKYKCLRGANDSISNCETDGTAHAVGETVINMSTSTGSGGPIISNSWITIENDNTPYEMEDGQSFAPNTDAVLIIKPPGLQQAISAGAKDVGNVDAEDWDPTLYPAYWEDLGAVNDYKPFDFTPLDRATRASSLSIEFDPDSTLAPNAVALINFIADDVGIKVESQVGGTLYDTTPSDTESIDISTTAGTWYSQFFDRSVKTNHAIFGFNDSNSYADLTVTVDMSVDSGNVEVGQIVVGPYADVGTVEAGGISIGLQDFSTVSVNSDLTNYTLTEGAAFQVFRIRTFIDVDYWPEAKRALTDVQGSVVVAVLDGDDGEGEFDLQGEGVLMCYLRDWKMTGHNGGTATIEIELLGLH